MTWGVRLAVALAGLAFLAKPAAGIAIARHGWDRGPHPANSLDNDVVLGYATTGGNPNGWMPITFPETTEPEIGVVEWDDVLYVNASDFFTANWPSASTIAFDFYTSNALPGYDETAEQFLADLAAIDWIGKYIFREDAGVEMYGLDNFRLLVPEPGQLALLGAVLLAGLINRRRKVDATGRPDGPPGSGPS